MPEDYDAPRKRGAEVETDSLEELQQLASHKQQTAVIDDDLIDFSLPGAEITDEAFSEDEFTAPVIPMQASEFRCSSCFLAHPMRRRAYNRNNEPVCNDCA